MIEALKGLPHWRIMGYTLTIFSLIVAPCFFIFQFQRPLFISLDMWKLGALSLGISIPWTFINASGASLLQDYSRDAGAAAGALINASAGLPLKEAEKFLDNEVYDAVLEGSKTTIACLYAPCLVTFFHELKFREAVYVALAAQLFFVVSFFVKAVRLQLRIKTPKPPNEIILPPTELKPLE